MPAPPRPAVAVHASPRVQATQEEVSIDLVDFFVMDLDQDVADGKRGSVREQAARSGMHVVGRAA